MVLNIAMKDIARFKEDNPIPKAYAGKKVKNLVQLQPVEKSLEDTLRDEMLADIEGEDDSDSDCDEALVLVEEHEAEVEKVEEEEESLSCA